MAIILFAANSKIGWTRHTCNLWWGCTKVHAGCDHCYAETLDNYYNANKGTHWGNDAKRKAIKSVWADFFKYQAEALAANEIHRVFVGSMMDIAEKSMPLEVPFTLPKAISENAKVIELVRAKITGGAALQPFTETGQLRDFFYNVIVPLCPNLQFLLLTKRPSNYNKQMPEAWKTTPPANVMFGTSVVNQETADRLVPQLLQVNGHLFLSCEPLLGPILLTRLGGAFEPINSLTGDLYETGSSEVLKVGNKINWVIAGGESGLKARPMHPDWIGSLLEQCQAAKVPFFFKQWGEYVPLVIAKKQNLAYAKLVTLNLDGTVDTEAQDCYCKVALVGNKNTDNLFHGKRYEQFSNHYKLPSNG